MALGRQLAPHVRKQGEKWLPDSYKKKTNGDGRSKVDNIMEVAVGGLKGNYHLSIHVLYISNQDDTVIQK